VIFVAFAKVNHFSIITKYNYKKELRKENNTNYHL